MNIMMLQETHSDVFNETDWRREFEGQVILSHFNNMSAGVALLFLKRCCALISCGGGADEGETAGGQGKI